MKNPILSFITILSLSGLLVAQSSVDFDQFFIDQTMRLDYFHIGDAHQEFITLDHVYQQGIWAGSQKNLLDHFDNGRYYVKIYDASSGKLIFSKGFDSYFGEYKTTSSALKGIKRTYHESALIPYPKSTIEFTIEFRNRENRLQPLFKQEIDPEGVEIIKEALEEGVKVFEVVRNGDPHQKVDLAFIAEGYTGQEEPKVKADLERFTKVFFSQEPYKTYKNNFNIYGVFKPSTESGCDEPTRGIYKNTALNTTFNSLGLTRYLLTEDNKALHDIAAHVPYDALFIMINQKRYGGGGIYNFFCVFTTDSQWHEYLLLHEFGHSFAGLADEYYTSSVAYNEFYPQGVEPTEPNITALLDPKNLKWKNFTTPGIDIPTPWEKEGFDLMDLDFQEIREKVDREIARMKKERSPENEIKELEDEAERISKEHATKMDEYLRKSKFWEKVGAFEGAGYSAQGLYRPMIDCLMFTKGLKPYCKVCEQAVIRVIKHYSE